MMRARDKLMNALHFKGYIPRVKVIIVSLMFVNKDVTRKLVELILAACCIFHSARVKKQKTLKILHFGRCVEDYRYHKLIQKSF
jgi:steroid 5-alpha reductase family enzyme